MQLLGKRSLSSFLKVLLNIAFYLTIVVVVALLVVLPLVFVAGIDNAELALPVFFEVDPSAYQLESVDGPQVRAEIEEASGTLNITGGRTSMAILQALGQLPVLAAAIVVLHRLRRIFRRLVEGRPFVAENANNLRFIGIAVIVGELAWAASRYWSTQLLVSEFTGSGVTLDADFVVRMPVVLAGLVILIIAEVFREGAKMKSDLDTAREIQFSLVSDPEYQNGAISIHSSMEPATMVGGDYYDIIDLGDGRIAFVVADVAGKGLPAALLMALLQGSLRSLISVGLRGSELVRRLNIHLVANTPDNRMVTFFYGELDPVSGRLDYVNAGHNPPYLCDGSKLTKLDSTGVVLGLVDDAPFAEASVELHPGARLFLYTDGVTEAANVADEEFGEERLEKLIGEQGHTTPASMIKTVVAHVTKFCGKAKPFDDMTMMVVSRSGG